MKQDFEFSNCSVFLGTKQITSEPISELKIPESILKSTISENIECYGNGENFSISFKCKDESGLLYIYALYGEEIRRTIHRMNNEWKRMFYKTIRQD